VEDAVAGVRSAVAAGFPTVGNLQFVPAGERQERIAALRRAGAAAVVPSWSHLAALLGSDPKAAPAHDVLTTPGGPGSGRAGDRRVADQGLGKPADHGEQHPRPLAPPG
jgi:hypothetical protein